jgi:putative ABC transport system permease protein
MFEIRPIFSAMLQHKSRAVLIILQMALTLAIVANALFIINERLVLIDRESGFKENQIFGLRTVDIKPNVNINQQIQLDEQMLRAIPGVIDAVAINHLPIAGSGSSSTFSLKADDDNAGFEAGVYRGDEHVLTTMGVELLEGRNFTQNEVTSGPEGDESVIVISAGLAQKWFPEGALGKFVYSSNTPKKIIGVVKVMQGAWVNAPIFNDNVILPSVEGGSFIRYMIRAEEAQKTAIMAQVKDKMLALNADRVVSEAKTMVQSKQEQYQGDSAMAKVLLTIIVLLLLVTVVGIFGLSSFSVNQRIKQIGTRRALGASKTDITRYFLIENALMAFTGITIGCVLSLALNYFLVNEYGVNQLSSVYVVATMFGLFMVSQLAVLMPALKAAQISPAIATR